MSCGHNPEIRNPMWPFSHNSNESTSPAQRVEPSFQNTSLESTSTAMTPASWLVDALGGGPSYAGPNVSEQSSMRSTTVFRCVSLVSGLVATIPLSIYEKSVEGRKDGDAHRLYYLLHDEPNDLMSSFTWTQLIVVDLLLGGNHYTLIERDNANRVVGFMPFQRIGVTPYRKNGRTRYRVLVEGGEIDLDQDDVLHIPGLGFDGLKGLSPIANAGKQTVGLDLAIQESTARLHANGVRPSGTMEVPANISPENFNRLKAQFEPTHMGAANVGKVIYTDKDHKWTSIQMSAQDAQILENRRFQVTDICRLFGVPPHLFIETDKSTSL